jgi:1-pyrroline-5-carboxylate dehydrogenase
MSLLSQTVSRTVRPRFCLSRVSISRNTVASAFLSMYKKPFFDNEPPKTYAKGSPERIELTDAITSLKARLPVDVPLIIDGHTVIPLSGKEKQLNPSAHSEVVAEWTPATTTHTNQAIEAALKAKPAWENTPFEDRAAIFLRAAELVAGKYRSELVAATMLGQGKNIWQAEIDAAAETCDLLRYALAFSR